MLVTPGAVFIISGNRPQSPDLRATVQELVQIFHIRIQCGIHDVADRLLRLQVSVQEKHDFFGLMAVKLVDGADDIGQREGDSSLQSLVVQYAELSFIVAGIGGVDAVFSTIGSAQNLLRVEASIRGVRPNWLPNPINPRRECQEHEQSL